MQSLNNIVSEASLEVPDYHLDHFQSRVLEELHLEFFFARCRFLITPACRYITTGKATKQEIAQLEGILAQRQDVINERKRYLMYGLTLYSALLETNSYHIASNDHLFIARFVGLNDAFEALEKSLEVLKIMPPHVFRGLHKRINEKDEDMAPLRSDKRFSDLMKKFEPPADPRQKMPPNHPPTD